MHQNLLNKIKTIFLGLGSALLLTHCAQPTAPTYQYEPWQTRSAQLQQFTNWDVAGAFSVQTTDQNVVAHYAWQQQGTQYQIRIQSALDLYAITIVGTPQQVTLWRSQKAETARDASTLLQQTVGWSLPINNLFYWIRGLPAPGRYQAQRDAFGHLQTLQQHGFNVQFSNYASQGPIDLPGTLYLNSPAQKISIKLVARWKN